jgi:hypothetical protein
MPQLQAQRQQLPQVIQDRLVGRLVDLQMRACLLVLRR